MRISAGHGMKYESNHSITDIPALNLSKERNMCKIQGTKTLSRQIASILVALEYSSPTLKIILTSPNNPLHPISEIRFGCRIFHRFLSFQTPIQFQENKYTERKLNRSCTHFTEKHNFKLPIQPLKTISFSSPLSLNTEQN